MCDPTTVLQRILTTKHFILSFRKRGFLKDHTFQRQYFNIQVMQHDLCFRCIIIGNCQRTCLPRGLLLFVYPVGLSELKLNSVNQKWSKKDRKVCFMTENDHIWPQLIKMTTSYRQRKKFYFTKYKLVSNAQIMEMPMVCLFVDTLFYYRIRVV